jgi:transposase
VALTVRVDVPVEDRAVLESWARSSSIPAGQAQRPRIVLLAADGVGTTESARRLGVSRPTVIAWKRRYAGEGVDGLVDRLKPGRPKQIDEAGIVVATLQPPPPHLGVTHWSSRLLAAELGVSNVTVAKVWRTWGLQPWRSGTFKFSTDPELDAKVRDVVGLYLAPPENAVVVCVDEKSQVQALDRTAPILPMRPGLPERATHDYVTARHHHPVRRAGGGHREGHRRLPRPAHQRRIPGVPQAGRQGLPAGAAARRGRQLRHPQAPHRAGLAGQAPRVTLHFTPTSGSWLNMVEIFFGIITRQAIRRGTFTSVKDLIAAIETFIDGWNDRCQPFTWTKTADSILEHARPRKNTSFTRH